MVDLNGRVAVVTGGATDLARGLTQALSRAGAVVRPLEGDFSTRATVQKAIDKMVVRIGPIHVVVHVMAAPSATDMRPLMEIDDARWNAVWEQSMRTALFVAQASHRHLAGRDGRLIFVTPTIALSGAAGLVAYATAAEGQRLLAKSAARQWGSDGITVNCIAPAAIDARATSLAPAALGSAGEVVDDIGPVVAFLASPESHFLTGATLAVDGGIWMAP